MTVAETSRPTLAHRVEDMAVGSLSFVLRFLPEVLAQGLGWMLGWTAGSIVRFRRATVDANLARAFPDRDPGWRRRVARRVFPHIGREAVTLLRLPGLGPEALRRRTRVEGFHVVQEAVAGGQGCIFLTGHVGNWEVGGGATAVRGIPLDVVARRQKNSLVDARLRATREALSMGVIYRENAVREVLRSLRGGRCVALAADQNEPGAGIFVDFFGVPASTARGPALFAARTGAPVVLAFGLREPGWRARYVVRFRRLEVPTSEDPQRDEAALTRAYLAALEEIIREVPEQYFWPHRRWKTQPVASRSEGSS